MDTVRHTDKLDLLVRRLFYYYLKTYSKPVHVESEEEEKKKQKSENIDVQQTNVMKTIKTFKQQLIITFDIISFHPGVIVSLVVFELMLYVCIIIFEI